MVPRPSDFVPPPAEPLELPLDALATRLLALEAAIEEGGGRVSFNLCVNRAHWGDYEPMGDLAIPFLRALNEARDWLFLHGLVGWADPDQSHDNHGSFITRLGRSVLGDERGVERLRAHRRLDVDLHPLVAARVRSQWILGEYEAAAFLAMREVEIRVRDLGGASDADLGVPLMQNSFRDGGALSDSTMEAGERQATMALFWGAIGVFKNPSSHRQVEYADPTAASEVVLLADLLLRVLASEPHTAEQARQSAAGSPYKAHSTARSRPGALTPPSRCQQECVPLQPARDTRHCSGGHHFPYVSYVRQMQAFRLPEAAVRLPLEGVPRSISRLLPLVNEHDSNEHISAT